MKLRRTVRTGLAIAIACGALIATQANAIDYTLDSSPDSLYPLDSPQRRAHVESEALAACQVYLKNLRYFAQKKPGGFSGQPIAPSLVDKLHAVEWEAMRLDEHPDLLSVLLLGVPIDSDPVTVDEGLRNLSMRIGSGEYLLRSAKGKYVGAEITNEGIRHSERGGVLPAPLQLIQFGPSDPPDGLSKCYPSAGLDDRGTAPDCSGKAGRTSAAPRARNLVAMTNDLARIYGRVEDSRGESAQNLWIINDRIYAEQIAADGAVRLSIFRDGFLPHLDPVCMFRLTKR